MLGRLGERARRSRALMRHGVATVLRTAPRRWAIYALGFALCVVAGLGSLKAKRAWGTDDVFDARWPSASEVLTEPDRFTAESWINARAAQDDFEVPAEAPAPDRGEP
jgi:hypothetical protein